MVSIASHERLAIGFEKFTLDPIAPWILAFLFIIKQTQFVNKMKL